MIPKSGYRFPACAKPWPSNFVWLDASAGEARSEKDHAQIKEPESDPISIGSDSGVYGLQSMLVAETGPLTVFRSLAPIDRQGDVIHSGDAGERCMLKALRELFYGKPEPEDDG